MRLPNIATGRVILGLTHGLVSRTVSAMHCAPFLERITLYNNVGSDNSAMQGEQAVQCL